MSRRIFSQELQAVKDSVLLFGSSVETCMLESVRALTENDLERSRLILKNVPAIRWKRYQIEIDIMVLIATQQPAARDLRTLAASFDVCTELERIADYARGIATINLRSEGLSMPRLMAQVKSMSEQAVDMLHNAMTAYASEDARAAERLIRSDDVIDSAYAELYTSVVRNVIADPRNIERANYLIWVAHNLERLGDRATNICERVMFMVNAERHPDTQPLEGRPQ